MGMRKSLVEKLVPLIKERFAPPMTFVYQDVERLLKEKLPDYAPTSASPALSHMRLVGIITSGPGQNGEMINTFVRDLTPKDLRFIRRHNTSAKAKRKANDGGEEGGAMIAIMLGENRTEIVDIAQAKRIYLSLKPIFEV